MAFVVYLFTLVSEGEYLKWLLFGFVELGLLDLFLKNPPLPAAHPDKRYRRICYGFSFLFSFLLVALKFFSLQFEAHLFLIYLLMQYLFLLLLFCFSLSMPVRLNYKILLRAGLLTLLFVFPITVSFYLYSIVVFWSIGILISPVSVAILILVTFMILLAVFGEKDLSRCCVVSAFLAAMLLNGFAFNSTTSLFIFFASVSGVGFYQVFL